MILNPLQWSRLLGGTGTASATKRADGASPQQRLIRFKKAHDQLSVYIPSERSGQTLIEKVVHMAP